jgi:hypothetical protein
MKWPGRETDRSSPSTAEVKECVQLYLHSLNTSSWHLVKYRDKFAFTFYILVVVNFCNMCNSNTATAQNPRLALDVVITNERLELDA